jgi:hypothetical protein|uniref:Glutaredoxin domain-containing protein n=1 Tax=viral metagenome TaxID=1070528 RepID=A0A6C0EC51_9ZZZZ
MKIIFYSNNCEKCLKIKKHIASLNFIHFFKFINIDENYNNIEYSKIIMKIDNNDLPLLLDTELNQPLKGELIYDYLKNIKYFNISTNNIKNIIPDNPIIEENMSGYNKNVSFTNLSLDHDNANNLDIIKENNETENENIQPIKNKKFKYYLLKR